MKEKEVQEQAEAQNILGLSTDEIAGLSVDELVENKTAITMLLHYYKLLTQQNTALLNERNTLKSYVEGYEKKKSGAKIGAILLTLSNIGIAFGINLLMENNTWPGMATLIPGLCMAGAGLYFTLYDRD